jgi:hypothetical protein
MASVIIALILICFIALVVGVIMFVHKRDQKPGAGSHSDGPSSRFP